MPHYHVPGTLFLLLPAASYQEALAELAVEAEAHGVGDLEAALVAVDSSLDNDVAALSREVRQRHLLCSGPVC